MFKCEGCKGVQPKGAKATRVVVERRDREYRDTDDKLVGKGWEIVREVSLCSQCVKVWDV